MNPLLQDLQATLDAGAHNAILQLQHVPFDCATLLCQLVIILCGQCGLPACFGVYEETGL